METKYTQDVKNILALAKAYAERHQIIYTDTHERMILMVIGESFKVASRVILEQNEPIINAEPPVPKERICYDMGIYNGQVPNTSVDFNKREKEID